MPEGFASAGKAVATDPSNSRYTAVIVLSTLLSAVAGGRVVSFVERDVEIEREFALDPGRPQPSRKPTRA